MLENTQMLYMRAGKIKVMPFYKTMGILLVASQAEFPCQVFLFCFSRQGQMSVCQVKNSSSNKGYTECRMGLIKVS